MLTRFIIRSWLEVWWDETSPLPRWLESRVQRDPELRDYLVRRKQLGLKLKQESTRLVESESADPQSTNWNVEALSSPRASTAGMLHSTVTGSHRRAALAIAATLFVCASATAWYFGAWSTSSTQNRLADRGDGTNEVTVDLSPLLAAASAGQEVVQRVGDGTAKYWRNIPKVSETLDLQSIVSPITYSMQKIPSGVRVWLPPSDEPQILPDDSLQGSDGVDSPTDVPKD